ncbi:MAG TPA: permease prefix domain 1-containing protein [Silvibacterium sp.]|nr:permease prefix domain 1-containing protein [Silvibacterium sp.]
MSLNSRIRTWWRAVTRRAELNDQLDEELRFHIESYTEDLMNQGLPREEAMRRAKAELGSVTAVRENSRPGVPDGSTSCAAIYATRCG